MSDFAGTAAGLAAALANLVRSPRVQFAKGQALKQLPSISGPLISNPIRPTRGASVQPSSTPHGINGIGSALGSILGGAATSLAGPPQDPMEALYAQLLDQLQQPVAAPTGVDTTDLMNQVKAAINPIYDARANTARHQASSAEADAKAMYGDLAKEYEKLAPQQAAQAQAAKQQIEGLYGQLRSNIQGNYSRVSNDQAELFKQLGIEDALPSVLDKQAPAVTDALTAASENQAQQEQRYQDIGNMDESYYRSGAPTAIMAGNEYAMDIQGQLGDLLNQIEGERASGIQSGYLDQLGQAQNSLAQQQQSAASETARRQEMLWQMLQSQMQNSQKSTQMTPDSLMSSLDPQTQQSVAGAFTQLQRSPEAVYGKVQDPRNPVPGSFVQTTPQWYLLQADQMYQNGQIDASTHQALLQYIQLMMGSK